MQKQLNPGRSERHAVDRFEPSFVGSCCCEPWPHGAFACCMQVQTCNLSCDMQASARSGDGFFHPDFQGETEHTSKLSRSSQALPEDDGRDGRESIASSASSDSSITSAAGLRNAASTPESLAAMLAQRHRPCLIAPNKVPTSAATRKGFNRYISAETLNPKPYSRGAPSSLRLNEAGLRGDFHRPLLRRLIHI